MSLEFNATLRDKGQGNDDKKKILLEVPIRDLKGKVEELADLTNKEVVIRVVPQFYSYSVPFDKSTNAPTMEYVVNNDGTIDLVKNEQTQLDVDSQGNIDIEDREFVVTKEIIDEFIRAAKALEFPGEINPRDVLVRSEEGETFGEIAESYSLSELSVINELEKAREYYAPYAAAWDKKRNEVIFQEKSTEKSDDFDASDDESEKLKKKIENNTTEGKNVPEEKLNSENGESEEGQIDEKE